MEEWWQGLSKDDKQALEVCRGEEKTEKNQEADSFGGCNSDSTDRVASVLSACFWVARGERNNESLGL